MLNKYQENWNIFIWWLKRITFFILIIIRDQQKRVFISNILKFNPKKYSIQKYLTSYVYHCWLKHLSDIAFIVNSLSVVLSFWSINIFYSFHHNHSENTLSMEHLFKIIIGRWQIWCFHRTMIMIIVRHVYIALWLWFFFVHFFKLTFYISCVIKTKCWWQSVKGIVAHLVDVCTAMYYIFTFFLNFSKHFVIGTNKNFRIRCDNTATDRRTNASTYLLWCPGKPLRYSLCTSTTYFTHVLVFFMAFEMIRMKVMIIKITFPSNDNGK